MNVQLRDYQIKIVNDLRNAYRKGFQSPLLVSPTGSGKTIIFSNIAESAVNKGNRVMILVHRKELLFQCSDALDDLDVPHGLIAPNMSMTADPVQVASVQTLRNRLEKVIRPQLIVVDECHHTSAGSWKKILTYYCPEILDNNINIRRSQPGGLYNKILNNNRTKILGVTATPHRLDGKGLGKDAGGFYDTLVHGPTVKELIDTGYLTKLVTYAPPTEFNTADFHTKFGDYDKYEVNLAVDKPKIVGNAVAHYQKICPGVPAIAFCASVEHAKHVSETFNAAGIPSESLDGKSDNYHRKYCISGLGDGRIKVLTSCEIISEGVDIPIVTTAILLRPTKSLSLYLQQPGRCLRPYPGKEHAIILDHVGNVFTHGPVDLVREWSLDGEDKKKKNGDGPPILFWQCKYCYTINEKLRQYCFTCGRPKESAKRFIDEIDGELKRIESERLEFQYQEQVRRDKRREEGMAQTLEDLYAIAKKRGYKPAWARMRYNARMRKSGAIA